MKKLVMLLLLVAIIVGNLWTISAQAQGGDCDLPPEDCAILEAHAAKMLDTNLLTVKDFTFGGSIDLPEPSEFSAVGHGSIEPTAVRGTKLTFDMVGGAVDQEVRESIYEVLDLRLDEYGAGPYATIEVTDTQVFVDLPETTWPDTFIDDLTKSGGSLLEFVDFTDVPMEIADGSCVLTDEQVARGYINGMCTNGETAIRLNGEPFHTIMTGNQLDDVVAIAGNNFGQWAISFTLTDTGTEIFSEFTGSHIGKRLAIVVDGIVISAPTIQQAITTGDGQITGDFSEIEAESLATQLREHDILPVKLQLTNTEPGQIYVSLDLSLIANPFSFNTEDGEVEDLVTLTLERGHLTVTNSTATTEFFNSPVKINWLWNELSLSEINLVRGADVDLEGATAMFESEIPLQMLFSDEVLADPLAKFLILVFFGDIDFEDYGLTRIEADEFLADTLQAFTGTETLLVRRYISLDDFSLRRLELSTDFEFPVHLLADTLQIPLLGEVTEPTVIHMELQADFE